MSPVRRAHLQMHLCVLLWGFTAILGKLISLEALSLVWWRMSLVTLMLLCVPVVWRGLRILPWRLWLAFGGVGAIVAAHWVTFYAAIKLANASVAATCMALCPVFLAFLEPFIARRRFSMSEVLLGVAVIPGVALVVGGIGTEMRLGLSVGVLSALLASTFGALNKRLVEKASPLAVTFVELGTGALLITAIAPFATSGPAFPIPDARDAALLMILAAGCTLIPFALSLTALRHLSAFGAQIIVNLEPVYAVILAVPLLSEHRELGATFYAGVAVILAAVFAQPLLERRRGAPATGSIVEGQVGLRE